MGWRRHVFACALAVSSPLAGCSSGAEVGGSVLSGPQTLSGSGDPTGTGEEATTDAPPGDSSGDIASTTSSGEGGSTSTSESSSGSGDASGSTGSVDVGPVGFDDDPGWVAHNLPFEGNDYGWRSTALAGGEPGEIGGFFQRPAEMSYYADVGIVVSSDAVIEATGRFNVVDVENDYNFNTFIGHFLSTDTDGGRLGVEILEPGGGAARIRLVHGANSYDVFDLQDLGIDRDWSYRYDPSVGTYGRIDISVEGEGSTSYDLTEDDRTSIASLDAFGFVTRQNPDVGEYTGRLEAYFDDIDYTR